MQNKFKRLLQPTINTLGRRKARQFFTRPPVLIGGAGRSGTTLLLAMLGAHPHIFAYPREMSVFNHWIPDKKSNPQGIPQRQDRMHLYLLTHRVGKQQHRWLEKTPRNILFLQEIFAYFEEEVQIIHIVRDARDVLLSKHPAKPGEYWISPERWVRDVKAGLAFAGHPGVLTIKYEDLVVDSQQSFRQICDFLQEPYAPELDRWHEITPIRKNHAWASNVQRVHQQSLQKWRNSSDAKRLDKIMNHPQIPELLARLDYPLD